MSETTEYRRENFMSDFDFILPLTDCLGNDLGWPDFDWEVGLWTTSQADMRRVGCRDGVPYGCFNDDGRVHVVLKDHGLRAGVLQARATAYLQNGIYPDGIQKRVRPSVLTIELVRGAGDCPTATEIELMLPFIKGPQGDKMTYGDLTDADKADLTEPIKEALEKDLEDVNIIGTPTGEVIEDIEPALVTEALRKVPQVLTPEEQAQVRKNLGVYDRQWLIDLFVSDPNGDYDYNATDGHPYLLNGLRMTEAEALNIALYGNKILPVGYQTNNQNSPVAPIRTNLSPINAIGSHTMQLTSLFYGQSQMEVARLLWLAPAGKGDTWAKLTEETKWTSQMFAHCRKLREVIGTIGLENVTGSISGVGMFPYCYALETVFIFGLKVNISFADSPLLSLLSLAFLVDNALNTTAITITVHPDVYAKLTDDTNTEWHQVLTDALDRNITFATV